MTAAFDEYRTREQASVATAERLAAAISKRLDFQERTTLVVSGGETPKTCLGLLSMAELPWHRVMVTLTDERCVAPTDPASNQRMVRETLLVGHARQASFVAVGEAALAQVPRPFAGVLLGMGEDGHIASLFPDMVNLAEGLAIDNESLCVDVETRAMPHHRVSMTLAALLQSDIILLLAFGDTKRNIIEQPDELPIAALLEQTRTHVGVMWAP